MGDEFEFHKLGCVLYKSQWVRLLVPIKKQHLDQ